MKKVLIAEDEKLIRRGLEAMVQRAPVEVSEVLTARDGREALAILGSTPVDLLITDVKMPNMDGIELVEETRKLPNPPFVVVISGYDDFNYAVSMMRQGVQEYLLKPVDRAKFYQAMKKIDEQISAAGEREENERRQFLREIRLLMLEGASENAGMQVLEKYKEGFGQEPYMVCYGNLSGQEELSDRILSMQSSEQPEIYLVPEVMFSTMSDRIAAPAGISCIHKGLEELHEAYTEAKTGWQCSFFSGEICREESANYVGNLTVNAKQLLGMLSLSWDKEAVHLMEQQAGLVADRQADPEAFVRLCAEFVQVLCNAYEELIEPEDNVMRFANPYRFGSLRNFLTEFEVWIQEFSPRIARKYSDYQNKQKIREAVQYMQQHFREPLNMAVVSNYVSMNYSLFSQLFKQYTGSNFVNYLQDLRLGETRRLLEETDLKVTEIRQMVGFSDEKHFLKVFKAVNGFSPTEYRKTKMLEDKKNTPE